MKNNRDKKTLLNCLKITFVVLVCVVLTGCLLNLTQTCQFIVVRWLAAASFYLTVLVLVGWMFSLLSLFLRKAIVSVAFFAVLFVCGSASYFIWHVDDDDAAPSVQCAVNGGENSVETDFSQQLLEAPNRAISSFFPSRGGFERIDRKYRFYYFLFHMLVFAFVAAVMFSLFGRGLVNRAKRRLIPERKLNVFWGVNAEGLILARDILETTDDEQVVFLLSDDLRFDEEKLKSAVWKVDTIGAVWVLADLVNPSPSSVRGHRHFFLERSGHVNVSRANQLVKSIEKQSGNGRPNNIYLYVRIEANEEEQMFFEWAGRVNKTVSPIIMRESDMIARRFILDNPMLNCPDITVDPEAAKVSGLFKVLLLGLGATGQSVLREVVSNGQFYGIKDFSVDVIEGDVAVVESYEAQHAEAIAKYKINFIKGVKAEGVGFEDFLANNLLSYNRIIVCLSGDVMNIRVASRIAHYVTPAGKKLQSGVLFVRVSDPNRYSYFAPASGMKLFGNLRDVYSLATLDYDPIDLMARALNGEWIKGKTNQEPSEAWLSISFEKQNSSRASALGERNLARVIGFEIVPQSDGRAEVAEKEFLSALKGDVGGILRETILAEDEHLRWNAYIRMLGYSLWDMKNPSIADESVEKVANQQKRFGKHACLVDFAALPNVDYTIACAINPMNKTRLKPADFEGDAHVDVNGDGQRQPSFQAYDYMFIRKICENAAKAGMKLVKAR